MLFFVWTHCMYFDMCVVWLQLQVLLMNLIRRGCTTICFLIHDVMDQKCHIEMDEWVQLWLINDFQIKIQKWLLHDSLVGVLDLCQKNRKGCDFCNEQWAVNLSNINFKMLQRKQQGQSFFFYHPIFHLVLSSRWDGQCHCHPPAATLTQHHWHWYPPEA